jgi:regulator of replication initiation timing
MQAVVNQDMVGDMKALQLENERLQRELAKRQVSTGGQSRLATGWHQA